MSDKYNNVKASDRYKHKRTTVVINPELKGEAKALGESMGLSISETVETALEFWLNNHHRL